MTPSEFFNKFKSWFLWGNLLAMALVIVLLSVGVKFGLDLYTHHGEEVIVPNVLRKSSTDAQRLLTQAGLNVMVVDTAYAKAMPEDCVLQQVPDGGAKVKSGRTIYLTVNSSRTPTRTIPDIIDNSSLREAMARLTAMGFKVGNPVFVTGEADWVYGILVNGRHVNAGDKVPVEATLIIQVGNGEIATEDSVAYVEPVYEGESEEQGGIIMGADGGEDDFEVVEGTQGEATTIE